MSLSTRATPTLPFEQVDQVVDTVGAGDGFCAGFLAGIAKGWTPEEALAGRLNRFAGDPSTR